MTKKIKNKVTKSGASFIIESNKNTGKVKSGAANLFQQAASKMQYIRVVKSSRDNSITSTPLTDEKSLGKVGSNDFKR